MENSVNRAQATQNRIKDTKTEKTFGYRFWSVLVFFGKGTKNSLQLLLIPCLTWWATQYLATETNGQKLLLDYYDKTETFFTKINNKIPNSPQTLAEKPTQKEYAIVNARTLSTLRELDGARKGILLSFWSDLTKDLTKENRGNALNRADLKKAYLEGLNLKEIKLQGADFRGANLKKTDLSGATLSWSVFGRGDSGWFPNNLLCMVIDLVPGEPKWFANNCVANLQEAKLIGTDLQNAKLQGADLQGADLQATKLQGAKLERVQLQKARYTDPTTSPEVCKKLKLKHPCPTIFPEGFDPQKAGMELVTSIKDLQR